MACRASQNRTRMGCAVFGGCRQAPQKSILKSYFKKVRVWPRSALGRPQEPVNRKRTPPDDTWQILGSSGPQGQSRCSPRLTHLQEQHKAPFLNSSGGARAEEGPGLYFRPSLNCQGDLKQKKNSGGGAELENWFYFVWEWVTHQQNQIFDTPSPKGLSSLQ